MLLVGNGLLVSMDEKVGIIEQGALLINGDTIVEVGDTKKLKEVYPDAQFIDATGRLILPGMINSHMHLYSTFARGLAIPRPPRTFVQILERLWWRLDKGLLLEDVYYSALVFLIDCVKNGTTTIIDHHASPGAVSGSLGKIVEAVEATGVRTALAYEVSDRDGVVIRDAGINENMEAIARYASGEHLLVRALFGLHASLTLNDETLDICRNALGDYGEKVGFHIHVAEGIEDVNDSLTRYGKRVVERLADKGILGPSTIAVHCVHVDDREIKILAETGTMVVHNPESNMGNAVGVAPVLRMLQEGVLLGLGTDGYTTDMFESIKVTNILHKLDQKDPSAAWAEVPQMAFANNREIARRVFGRDLGVLRPGAAADVIIVDYYPPTPLTVETAYSHLLFGVSGGRVDTTIINGSVRMLERKLQGIDEAAICVKAKDLAAHLWSRI
jgi:putative selenium metabolism protein SsnA